VKRAVFLAPAAHRQLAELQARERSTLRRALVRNLQNDDATLENRNRFRLRRASPHADYELRVGSLRAFYRVIADRVLVVLIGRKEGNALIIEGKRFVL
jgi:mRNA-degrading endonuclease RelE of RelBE toxin-antitoxin system